MISSVHSRGIPRRDASSRSFRLNVLALPELARREDRTPRVEGDIKIIRQRKLLRVNNVEEREIVRERARTVVTFPVSENDDDEGDQMERRRRAEGSSKPVDGSWMKIGLVTVIK